MKLKIKFMLFIMLFSVVTVVSADEVDLAKNAKSAILIEASTGEIMWEKNAHEKLAPASMTKMMSMLLVVESIDKGNLKWDQMITVSENASKMGGSHRASTPTRGRCGLLCIPHDPQTGVAPLGIPSGHNPFSSHAGGIEGRG